METRASKKKKLLLLEEEEEENQNKDRISNLPDAISHHILSFLPIKTLAQTSILSERFRYLWSSFPSLDFSDADIACRISRRLPPASKKTHYPPTTKPVEHFVNLLLSRRHENSNIKSFRFTGALKPSSLRNCIRSLVLNHKVEELDLDLFMNYPFVTPRCLLFCESLKTLNLRARTPITNSNSNSNKYSYWNWNHGFRFLTKSAVAASTLLRSLRSLSLTSIQLTNSDLLADLFSESSFPLLKKLRLSECEYEGINNLNISCPNLEDLTVCMMAINGLKVLGEKLEILLVRNCFHDCSDESWVEILAPRLKIFRWEHNGITEKCSVMSFPLLSQAVICLRPSKESAAKAQSAATILSGLSKVGGFLIGFRYVEILSAIYSTARGLPYSFDNLETLIIHTGLSKYDIPGVACLLKNTPILQALTIKIFNDVPNTQIFWNGDFWDNAAFSEEEYWESQSPPVSRPFLDHLEVVRVIVRGITINESAIKLVKFLLKHACVLKEMTLSLECSEDQGNRPHWQQICGSIKESPQASPNVDIIFG